MRTDFKNGPKLISIKDEQTQSRMIIAINSMVRGRSSGGIRVLSDVSEQELVQLAKSMRLKYGFVGIPVGGAKAGVRTTLPPASTQRIELFKRFGEKLAPMLRAKEYIPGFDMGTDITDIEYLFKGAGIVFSPNSWGSETNKYTAWSMMASVKEVLVAAELGLEDKTVVIDGFGNVGREFAVACIEAGWKVIAVSNICGAVINKNGIELQGLTEGIKKHGEEFINSKEFGKSISREELFSIECDIFASCGRDNPISESNLEKFKAKIICAGHNSPLPPKVNTALAKKGVIYIPGFIANSGGVLGAHLGEFFSDEEIRQIIYSTFAEKVRDCASIAFLHNTTLQQVGASISEKNFEKIKRIAENKSIITRGKTFLIGKLPTAIAKRIVAKKYLQMEFV